MHNNLKPKNFKILNVKDEEGGNSKLFTIERPADFEYAAGQFVIISIPGFGEAPISICSSPKIKKSFDLLIRKVGSLTTEVFKKKKGDVLGVRGPYGNGFPLDKIKNKNFVIVVGGCGVAPLRGVILEIIEKREDFGEVFMFYGVRNPEKLIFKNELKDWSKKIDLHVSFDELEKKDLSIGCDYSKGVVTKFFKSVKMPDNLGAFLCGPPVIYRFTIQELKNLKVNDSDIYLSLERRMECGLGICEHCGYGPFYVCKDGPVFSYEQIKGIKEEL